jgi:hypothetical protein
VAEMRIRFAAKNIGYSAANFEKFPVGKRFFLVNNPVNYRFKTGLIFWL